MCIEQLSVMKKKVREPSIVCFAPLNGGSYDIYAVILAGSVQELRQGACKTAKPATHVEHAEVLCDEPLSGHVRDDSVPNHFKFLGDPLRISDSDSVLDHQSLRGDERVIHRDYYIRQNSRIAAALSTSNAEIDSTTLGGTGCINFRANPRRCRLSFTRGGTGAPTLAVLCRRPCNCCRPPCTCWMPASETAI